MVQQLSLEQIVGCGVDQERAITLLSPINQPLATLPADACWQWFTRHLLRPDQPFALHQLLYEVTFSAWDKTQGPPPIWVPSPEQIQATHIADLLRELNLNSYAELHAWSVQHRDRFWARMIQRLGIRLQRQYSQIVDLTQGIESPVWLVDARLNIVDSCFQAPTEAPAIVYQPEGGVLHSWTYGELQALTNRVANSLIEAGFHAGDPIAIALPMTAESVALYLGIVKAGCVVVSIADSFAANEIATRLQISGAKAIFTQDFIFRNNKHLPLYTKIVAANAPPAVVLSSSSAFSDEWIDLRPDDQFWDTFLGTNDHFNSVSADPSAHTNILFSSGTTGEPKAIPWTHTTPIKSAADGHLHHDIHPGDIVAWPTSLGWMMGPWLIYASLINQATIALYYGTPCDREFGLFVQEAHVNLLGVVPSLVSLWRTTQCMQGLDWHTIKAFSSTGECSNSQDMLFLMALAGYKPIIEYCGGTEIGGGYITGTLVQPAAPATFTTPALGLDLIILDPDEQPTDQGEAFIIPPSIGLSTELINRDHHQVYFADSPCLPAGVHAHQGPLRRHGDQMQRLAHGYYRAQGRVDDTMNLGGIKVSSVAIEQILNLAIGVCETAAIAVTPADGGPSQLVIYAVVTSESEPDLAILKTKFQALIKQYLNPLFKIYDVVITETLPRTASNKVMRRTLRDRYAHDNHL